MVLRVLRAPEPQGEEEVKNKMLDRFEEVAASLVVLIVLVERRIYFLGELWERVSVFHPPHFEVIEAKRVVFSEPGEAWHQTQKEMMVAGQF